MVYHPEGRALDQDRIFQANGSGLKTETVPTTLWWRDLHARSTVPQARAAWH